MAWHYGLTGIGFWSYCTSRADPWFVPEATRDYLLIYQGDDIVVSKRWEAVRDGIEDYDMLCVLREAVTQAKNDNRAPEAVKHAEALLGERASTIGAFCGLDDDGMLPGQDGLPEVRRVANRRFETIQAFRRDLNTLLEALR